MGIYPLFFIVEVHVDSFDTINFKRGIYTIIVAIYAIRSYNCVYPCRIYFHAEN